MGYSKEAADARRVAARVALAIVTTTMATLVMLGSGTLKSISFAQQATTPAPSIEFVNPDDGTSTEITAINDGVDTAYHLVAWVNSLPSNPTVEFKFRPSGSNTTETNIGVATYVGKNTFEYKWQLGDMPADETTGTLRVVLFSGTTPVAEDSETVRINNAPDDDPSPTEHNDIPNAVEILYPANAGEIGFYPRAAGESPSAQIDVSVSNNTQNVAVYYTIVPVGTEPEWTFCGRESRDEARDGGVTCTLADDDRPEQVEGVAAVTEDANDLSPTTDFRDVDSADAHRADGYLQDPRSVSLSPVSQRVDMPQGQSTFPCSDVIVAQVFDQLSRRIVGAHVDVHAQGPADGLRFDSRGTSDAEESSPHRAPDRGGHTTEPEANCESTTTPPPNASTTQGEHELQGERDIKHIESTVGTNDHGEFRFRLISTFTSGVTQFTVWADKDDDDLRCEQEPRAHGSIGWGTEPSSPTGVPADQSTCPSPAVSTPATPTDDPSTQSPSSPPPSSPPPSSPPPSSPPPSSPPPSSPTPDPTPDPDPRGCTHVGDDGDNLIRGTDGDDIICAGAGHDTIYAGDGDDIIYGEEGHDSVRGNRGDDRMIGGGGGDTLRGGRGADTARGNGGNDTIRAYSENDDLGGGSGNDVISGSIGNDFLRGNRGRDTLNGGDGRDTCRGGPDEDAISRCER